MDSENRIIAVLFSDIAKYSEIIDDNLLKILDNYLNDIISQAQISKNHIFANTWGDGLFICNFDASELAEFALRLRDSFRSTNWVKKGFKSNLNIRIGLHVTKAKIIMENSKVKSVVGQGITSTARIEPIVPNDSVYCSKSFEQIVSIDTGIRIDFNEIGKLELAKGFGEMQLFELKWAHEKNTTNIDLENTHNSTIVLKKEYSDKERDDFILNAFQHVKNYFQKTLKSTSEQHNEIEFTFQELTSQRFWCKLYVNGKQMTECSIWFGNDMYGRGISYSNSSNSSNNSINDSLTIDEVENNLVLRPTMGYIFSSDKPDYFVNPDEVAEFLWRRFTERLT